MRLSKSSLFMAAFAATAATGTFAHADGVETVVVTATRTPQALSATGDSLTVLMADMLQAHQNVSLSDALAAAPGTTVVRNGGLGQTATLSLRGATPGQTLVLVDGVRINDPSTVDDQAILGDVFVNDIERVEILRGPQSALYGSDAIGGVVDIVTRRGGDSPFALRASAEGGSFNTYRTNAGANGTLGSLDYGAAVQYLHTSGISAADARLGNSEPDGTANLTATASARYHVLDNLSVDLRGYFIRARTDFDDNYPPPAFTLSDSPVYQRNILLQGYAGVNWDVFGGRLTNRFSFSQTDSRRATYDSPFFLPLFEDYAYHGTAQRFEYQGTAGVRPGAQLVFGAETERTSLTSQTAGFADTAGHVRTSGYYVEGIAEAVTGLTLTAGARLEDNDSFGTHAAYKASAAWRLFGGGTILRANFGTGFKAPTLYQQFSAYSNPVSTLAPETAEGWEAGADQHLWDGRVLAQLTLFDRRTKNLIDFASCYFVISPACLARPFGYYYNVGRAKSQGIEASFSMQLLSNVSASANYTYLQATDETAHTVLARRPHNTASGSLSWQPVPRWSLGAQILYVGARYDSSGDFNPQPGHTTADVFASYKLMDNLELYGRVENIGDAHYEPAAGYGAPGRAVYGGVRVSY